MCQMLLAMHSSLGGHALIMSFEAVIVANVHLTADMPDGSGGTASRQAHRAEQLKICEDLLHDRQDMETRKS